MDPEPRYWFAAKRYGWGWGPPVTWQGWLVTVVWMAVFLAGSLILARRSLVGLAGFSVAMTTLLVAICLMKGEPPGWRWGGRGRDRT
jgi:hypothetical protein